MAQKEFEEHGKYTAKVLSQYCDQYKNIGNVSANSLKELYEKARWHSYSWNEHSDKLFLQIINNKTDEYFEREIKG